MLSGHKFIFNHHLSFPKKQQNTQAISDKPPNPPKNPQTLTPLKVVLTKKF